MWSKRPKFSRGISVTNHAELQRLTPDERARALFNKYDIDGNGYINCWELHNFINSTEYDNDIPKHVAKKIHQMADSDNNGELDYEEFKNMLKDPKLKPLFGNLMSYYMQALLPPQDLRVEEIEYESEYTCCPPPVFMAIISIVEIVLYVIDACEGYTNGAGPVAKHLIYDPTKRQEAWRYFTYMFVHIGVLHLIVNLAVQILLGIPLEMVHKGWRVLFIYFSGVIAGSLGASLTDPYTKLAGASGGVYSLLTAHIATIIMNWKEMAFPLVQMIIFLIIIGADIGTSIYNRYVLDINDHVSYVAHFAGALAGLLVGIYILRNLEEKKFEKYIWWAALIIYVGLMAFAILWNIFATDHFPKGE